MAHFKKLPQVRREGKLIYGKDILFGIVKIAIEEIDFIDFALIKNEKSLKDIIKISHNKNLVDVFVDVRIHFSKNVSEMAFIIQETIRHNIETMTEYRVNSVDVKVSGIFFDDINKENKEENLINKKDTTIEVKEVVKKSNQRTKKVESSVKKKESKSTNNKNKQKKVK